MDADERRKTRLPFADASRRGQIVSLVEAQSLGIGVGGLYAATEVVGAIWRDTETGGIGVGNVTDVVVGLASFGKAGGEVHQQLRNQRRSSDLKF